MPTIHWNLISTPLPTNLLSPSEEVTLSALRVAQRRAEWLLGRAAAKALLRAAHPACAAISPAGITIRNDPSGAPAAALGELDLPGCLSISHRAGQACAALTLDPDLPCGIDLEHIEPRTPAFIDTFFTPLEAAAVQALPVLDRNQYAVLCWSAKEAVLKALRLGLRADTRTVELLHAGPPGPDGWGALSLRSTLPGAGAITAWWRREGEELLTLAALIRPETGRITLAQHPG